MRDALTDRVVNDTSVVARSRASVRIVGHDTILRGAYPTASAGITLVAGIPDDIPRWAVEPIRNRHEPDKRDEEQEAGDHQECAIHTQPPHSRVYKTCSDAKTEIYYSTASRTREIGAQPIDYLDRNSQLATFYVTSAQFSRDGKSLNQYGYRTGLEMIISLDGQNAPENHMALHLLYQRQFPEALKLAQRQIGTSR